MRPRTRRPRKTKSTEVVVAGVRITHADRSRNAANGTVIASFSPRARGGAPVAVPLTWDELLAGSERPVFTVNDVPDRVRAQKHDPWKGFANRRQSLPRFGGR